MTSRKRNKGKDRKAKKAALEAEKVDSVKELVRHQWHAWALDWMIVGELFLHVVMGVP